VDVSELLSDTFTSRTDPDILNLTESVTNCRYEKKIDDLDLGKVIGTENVSTRSEAHLTDPGPANFVNDSFVKTPKRAGETRSFFAKDVKILFI
jgi:hypothetical protein